MRDRVRTWGCGALAAACLLALVSCSSSPADAESSSPAPVSGAPTTAVSVPTPSPVVDPAAATRAEILRVYAEFMYARNVSLHDPRLAPDRRLWKVSINPARNDLYNLVLYERERGIKYVGRPKSTVSSVSMSTNTARLRDCVDSRSVDIVVAKSGKSLLVPGQVRVVPVEVEVTLDGMQWQVKTWVPKRGEAC